MLLSGSHVTSIEYWAAVDSSQKHTGMTYAVVAYAVMAYAVMTYAGIA